MIMRFLTPHSRHQQGERHRLVRQLGLEEFEAVGVVVGEHLAGDDPVVASHDIKVSDTVTPSPNLHRSRHVISYL